MKEKVEVATILGTIQATFTDFKYLRKIWKKNAEEERLLGVSLGGVYDHAVLNKPDTAEPWLEELNKVYEKVNIEWSNKLGINPSKSGTCLKPEGTTSQLVDAASGIHPRHSKFYIRRVRGDNKDPITQFMKDQGIPHEACVFSGETTTVFSFPIKAPEGALTRHDVTALDHLDLWKTYNQHWAEHQVSVTVNLREHEWMEAGAWVYKNFDEITGISFLPMDTGSYRQAPYEDCTEEQYYAMLNSMPKDIDWSQLARYEQEDKTTGSQEYACVGNLCEII